MNTEQLRIIRNGERVTPTFSPAELDRHGGGTIQVSHEMERCLFSRTRQLGDRGSRCAP